MGIKFEIPDFRWFSSEKEPIYNTSNYNICTIAENKIILKRRWIFIALVMMPIVESDTNMLTY